MKTILFTDSNGTKFQNKPTRSDSEKTYSDSDVPKGTDSIIYSFLRRLKRQGVELGFELPSFTVAQAKALTPDQIRECLVVPELTDEIRSKVQLVDSDPVNQTEA